MGVSREEEYIEYHDQHYDVEVQVPRTVYDTEEYFDYEYEPVNIWEKEAVQKTRKIPYTVTEKVARTEYDDVTKKIDRQVPTYETKTIPFQVTRTVPYEVDKTIRRTEYDTMYYTSPKTTSKTLYDEEKYGQR